MEDYPHFRLWPNEPIQAEVTAVKSEQAWPLVSLVTSSCNQAPYLEVCVRSVLEQGYSNLEYWVFDRGSTDSSLDMIRKGSNQLTGWQSQANAGQADAIDQAWERIGLAVKTIRHIHETPAMFRLYDKSRKQAGSGHGVEERMITVERVLAHPNCPVDVKRKIRQLWFCAHLACSGCGS
jgi:cellulose synthase/poly-beta-1,6-N-acetylglucosamine synthase-like glycosyltransferase